MPLGKVLAPLAPPACAACGAEPGPGGALCVRCRVLLRWLGGEPVRLGGVLEAWAPVAYRGPAAACVRALKFRGARALADAMAAAIAAGAPEAMLRERTAVPVPLHPARRRRRGFNQAEELARALGRRAGLPVCDCLARRGARTTQMGRGAADRRAALGGPPPLHVRHASAPRRAVLVDDVLTTGSTLLACAAALRAAGSEDVVAVAYARTPGR